MQSHCRKASLSHRYLESLHPPQIFCSCQSVLESPFQACKAARHLAAHPLISAGSECTCPAAAHWWESSLHAPASLLAQLWLQTSHEEWVACPQSLACAIQHLPWPAGQSLHHMTENPMNLQQSSTMKGQAQTQSKPHVKRSSIICHQLQGYRPEAAEYMEATCHVMTGGHMGIPCRWWSFTAR